MTNYYQMMMRIYERLLDEESRKLFELRIAYLIDNNQDNYMKAVCKLYDDWKAVDIEEKAKAGGVIVFGCGRDGKMANILLSAWGYKVICFCDTYKYGGTIDGKDVLSVDEVVEKYRDNIVVIASSLHVGEMYRELVQRGFPYANIVLPKYKKILAIRGKQYFDVFEPCPEEVYIDAGTFDGETIFDFIEWTNGNYKKIYSFEPMENMYKIICQKVENADVKDIQILNNAAWNQKEEIHFKDSAAGSHMDSNGESVVKGIDIDSVVNHERVTFIKMDIEGSELKALEGAKNTIKKNRPRLAICIYHKPLDVVEIAAYLLELVPEYKFYIRQYASNMWETVLYAVVG